MQSLVLTSAELGAHCAQPCLHKRGAAFQARTLKVVPRNMGETSRKLRVAKLLTLFSPCEVISLSPLVFVKLVVNFSIHFAPLVLLYYLGNSAVGFELEDVLHQPLCSERSQVRPGEVLPLWQALWTLRCVSDAICIVCFVFPALALSTHLWPWSPGCCRRVMQPT